MRTIGWVMLAGTIAAAAAQAAPAIARTPAAVSLPVPVPASARPPALALAPPTVRVDARALQPGEVMSVTIASVPAGEEPRVAFHGKTIPAFAIASSTWRALAGIDLDVTPGRYDVTVEVGPASAPQKATRAVVVTRKVFRTRRLTMSEAYVNPPPDVEARIVDEAARLASIFSDESTPRLWHGAFRRPVPDPANSAFGSRSILNGQPRSPHGGTDFLSAAGTPVHAPNAGRVVLVEDLYYTGNTVVIDHGQGLVSLFAHLSATSVDAGQMVETGDLLGRVGSTGRVTGPHLHWTVRLGNARVDPLSLVAIAGDTLPAATSTAPPAPRRPAAGAVR